MPIKLLGSKEAVNKKIAALKSNICSYEQMLEAIDVSEKITEVKNIKIINGQFVSDDLQAFQLYATDLIVPRTRYIDIGSFIPVISKKKFGIKIIGAPINRAEYQHALFNEKYLNIIAASYVYEGEKTDVQRVTIIKNFETQIASYKNKEKFFKIINNALIKFVKNQKLNLSKSSFKYDEFVAIQLLS